MGYHVSVSGSERVISYMGDMEWRQQEYFFIFKNTAKYTYLIWKIAFQTENVEF